MSFSRSAAASCLVILVCLAATGCDFFTGAKERADRAETLLAKGDYSEAMIELKNALGSGSDDARVRLLIARASLQLGSLDAAAKALDDAASAGADPADVASLRAQVLLRGGKYSELLAFVDDHMPVKNPDDATQLRVQALGTLDRCNEAIPLARTLLAKDKVHHAAAAVVIADCYARRGSLPRALRELDAAVAGAPQDAEAWLARGRLQGVSGKGRDAEESLGKSAQFAPGQLSVPQQALLYSTLADFQIARNDVQALHATREKLLRIAPQATITELVGARLKLMEGDVAGAVTTLRQLASSAGDVQAVHLLLASAYVAQSNFEQARQELDWIRHQSQDASRLDAVRPRIDALANLPADSEQFWLNSAAVQMALGQMDLARAALTHARTKSPASFQAPLALAQLEFRAGEPAKALALTSELAEKFPNQPEVLAVHAKMLGAANRAAESAALLERLQAQSPSSSLALAIHQVRKLGSLANPNEPLERWLANNPRDLPMRAAYAEVLQNDGQNRRAIGEYETLVGLAPKSAPAINNLAWLYYLEHDDRAVATARRAWELAPKVATIADTYGWLLVDSGKVREGVELLEGADAAGGILQPEIRLHLVVGLDREGDRERSQALLKALMAESPEFPNQAEATRLLDSLRQPGAT